MWPALCFRYSLNDGAPTQTAPPTAEVAVTEVARLIRLTLKNGEDDALRLDGEALRGPGMAAVRALPGFVKVVRTVCKSEWAYEVAIVFDSHSNFENFLASDALAALEATRGWGAFAEVAVDGNVYTGARVYDEL